MCDGLVKIDPQRQVQVQINPAAGWLLRNMQGFFPTRFNVCSVTSSVFDCAWTIDIHKGYCIMFCGLINYHRMNDRKPAVRLCACSYMYVSKSTVN